MRIGILTHPQAINYGGILQCYALFTTLGKLGHDVIVIRRGANTSKWRRIASWFIYRLGLRKLIRPNVIDKSINIRTFSNTYLVRTKQILSQKEMSHVCQKYKLEAVVVGSDQVWRADYALAYGYNYFLDFVPNGIKRFSYAASFGLSSWNYNPEQTQRIKELLSTYDRVSVREEEAVQLCKENLGMDVIQMPDPTLLLSSSYYDMVSSERLIAEKYVFVYWLGEKKVINEKIAQYEENGYKVIYLGLREQRILPSVEDWLSYIKYADIILTDSFHGCVFSMIYRKEFHVFSNDTGGNGRIESLFRQFGVEGSTVTEVNYEKISNIFNSLQVRASNYLTNILQ